jgi:hypothetical protein
LGIDKDMMILQRIHQNIHKQNIWNTRLKSKLASHIINPKLPSFVTLMLQPLTLATRDIPSAIFGWYNI